MESMEKEIIDLYKHSLNENIKYYDEKLKSMKNNYNEKDVSGYFTRKNMMLYCLQLLEKWERVVYNKERSY